MFGGCINRLTGTLITPTTCQVFGTDYREKKMIDDLLLQEVFSLRQKVLILAELLAKHEPELCVSGLLHDIGTEDYISTKNTEQANQLDSQVKYLGTVEFNDGMD